MCETQRRRERATEKEGMSVICVWRANFDFPFLSFHPHVSFSGWHFLRSGPHLSVRVVKREKQAAAACFGPLAFVFSGEAAKTVWNKRAKANSSSSLSLAALSRLSERLVNKKIAMVFAELQKKHEVNEVWCNHLSATHSDDRKLIRFDTDTIFILIAAACILPPPPSNPPEKMTTTILGPLFGLTAEERLSCLRGSQAVRSICATPKEVLDYFDSLVSKSHSCKLAVP